MPILIMELSLKRVKRTDRSTVGQLFVNGKLQCHTLEDRDRSLAKTMDAATIAKLKVFGRTAIPTGRYRVVLSYSNRFKTVLPEILGVPGFSGIRIHPGNKPEDTEGCLLVGNEATTADWISDSRIAFAALFARLQAAAKTELIYITIA